MGGSVLEIPKPDPGTHLWPVCHWSQWLGSSATVIFDIESPAVPRGLRILASCLLSTYWEHRIPRRQSFFHLSRQIWIMKTEKQRWKITAHLQMFNSNELRKAGRQRWAVPWYLWPSFPFYLWATGCEGVIWRAMQNIFHWIYWKEWQLKKGLTQEPPKIECILTCMTQNSTSFHLSPLISNYNPDPFHIHGKTPKPSKTLRNILLENIKVMVISIICISPEGTIPGR